MSNDLDIHLKEYDVLRHEITQNLNHAERVTGYTLVALAGLWGSQKWISENSDLAIMLLVFPIIFALLGFLFLDRIIRVNRLADYVHNVLRKKILKHCSEPAIQWEVYKKHLAVYPGMLLKAVNISRMGLFVLPGFISIAIYFMGGHHNNGMDLTCFLLVIDIGVMLVLIKGLLQINEAPGVETDRHIICDTFEPDHVIEIINNNKNRAERF